MGRFSGSSYYYGPWWVYHLPHSKVQTRFPWPLPCFSGGFRSSASAFNFFTTTTADSPPVPYRRLVGSYALLLLSRLGRTGTRRHLLITLVRCRASRTRRSTQGGTTQITDYGKTRRRRFSGTSSPYLYSPRISFIPDCESFFSCFCLIFICFWILCNWCEVIHTRRRRSRKLRLWVWN